MRSRCVLALAFLSISFALAPLAEAKVFKVGGPKATHASLALAVAAANALPGADEIRLRSGEYEGGVALADQPLTISGGWNTKFKKQKGDETATTVRGPEAGASVFFAPNLTGVRLEVHNLTLTDGRATGTPTYGGGLYAKLLGNAVLLVRKVVFEGNQAPSGGGGLFATAKGAANRMILVASRFDDNAAGIYAGGASLEAESDAVDTLFEVFTNQFTANSVDNDGALSSGSCPGFCVVSLAGAQRSLLTLTDTVLEDNRAVGGAGWSDNGLTVSLNGVDDQGEVRRLRLDRNALAAGDGSGLPQARFYLSPSAALECSDSLVSRSDGVGVAVENQGGSASFVNLTIIDNLGLAGLLATGPAATTSVANSIVLGSELSFSGTSLLTLDTNLEAGNPRFINRNRGDYRLKRKSAAVNGGKNNPQGGLGPSDLDGQARVKGGKVDLGAYESF